MNNIKHILIFSTLLLFINSCKNTIDINELNKLAAIETYPNDTFLNTVSKKRALIIVAHDDDDCIMSGTIAKLTSEGWNIKQLSLVKHINKKTGKNAAQIICDGAVSILNKNDSQYRMLDKNIEYPYLPIPYKEIKEQYFYSKVENALINKINTFNPSVIFTLDNIKGGYGHPDHIFISQLVVDLFKTNKINIDRIYQSVYTPHMENEIIDKLLKAKMDKFGYPNPSTIANILYDIEGMPEPDVQITIEQHASTKMKYLREYPEKVKRNLRKFIPYYEAFKAEDYFSVFDREFFRIIKK